jgi:hypothetical protein
MRRPLAFAAATSPLPIDLEGITPRRPLRRARGHRDCSHAEAPKAKARYTAEEAEIFRSANTDHGSGHRPISFFEGVS